MNNERKCPHCNGDLRLSQQLKAARAHGLLEANVELSERVEKLTKERDALRDTFNGTQIEVSAAREVFEMNARRTLELRESQSQCATLTTECERLQVDRDKLIEFVKKGEARLAKETTGVSFTIHGQPVGKPRQTRRDVWKKRPCVMRYRAWADKARAAAPDSMPKEPSRLHIVAYLSFPKSWRPNLRKALTGQPHRHKPDADNIIKSCADALFSRDEGISRMLIEKYWDDGNGPRMEVTVI